MDVSQLPVQKIGDARWLSEATPYYATELYRVVGCEQQKFWLATLNRKGMCWKNTEEAKWWKCEKARQELRVAAPGAGPGAAYRRSGGQQHTRCQAASLTACQHCCLHLFQVSFELYYTSPNSKVQKKSTKGPSLSQDGPSLENLGIPGHETEGLSLQNTETQV